MENNILKAVLLAQIHGGILEVSEAVRIFGQSGVGRFRSEYPNLCEIEGYLGRGDAEEQTRRAVISRNKIERARCAVRCFRFIPWIRFVGVSGGVSYLNAKAADDIDLFMVVQNRRLWISRGLEALVLLITGNRRMFGARNVRDKLCVNFYITEAELTMAEDFLNALEIANLRPVYNTEYIHYILDRNSWIHKYTPGLKSDTNVGSARRIPVISNILDLIDYLAMQTQVLYMKLRGHLHSEIVLGKNVAKFFAANKWEQRRVQLEEALDSLRD